MTTVETAPSPDLRAIRRALRTLGRYTGPDSIRRAVALRSALVDPPGRGGRERRVLAREVERALGRLMIEGRRQGHIASNGDRAGLSIRDLGLPRDAATDAVAMAKPPRDVWMRLLETTDAREELARACREWRRREDRR